MKVIVGVDGSSNSFAAVAFIGRLISPDRDELLLFFATPSMSIDDERLNVDVQERARGVLSRTILDAALSKLPEQWRDRAEQKHVDGPPGPKLIETAEEYGAALIVVGFHGTSSIIEQFILGSVSRKVLHSANVPVLVVKGSAEDASASAAADRLQVLVAYDIAHSAEAIANVLSQFTWPAKARGDVLTVVRPMFLSDLPDWVKVKPRDPDVAAMADEWQKEHEQNLDAAQQELERFRGMLPQCFAKGQGVVEEGRPAERIITMAKDQAIDLIVLGSKTGRLERLLLGSTSEQVIASGTCSVLVVR